MTYLKLFAVANILSSLLSVHILNQRSPSNNRQQGHRAGSSSQPAGGTWFERAIMDPLTALGVASNIISVIEISAKLVSKSIEVYSSGSGTTAENEDIRQVTEDLEIHLARLLEGWGALSDHDADKVTLRGLAKECRRLCSDLLKCLRKIQAKNATKLESAKAAVRSMTRKGELESLQRRIALYQSQIFQRLQVMMRLVLERGWRQRKSASTANPPFHPATSNPAFLRPSKPSVRATSTRR